MASSSSSIFNDWPAWDLLEIMNVDDHSFTCVGYASSKRRRCRNSIANPNKIATKRILDSLPEFVHSSAALVAQLRIVVPMAICKHRKHKHQDQADSIVQRWYDTIMAAVRRSRSATLEAQSDDEHDDGYDDDADPGAIFLDSVQSVLEPSDIGESGFQPSDGEIEDPSEESSVTLGASRALSPGRSASIWSLSDPYTDTDSWVDLGSEGEANHEDHDNDTYYDAEEDGNVQAHVRILADEVIVQEPLEEVEAIQLVTAAVTPVTSQGAERCQEQLMIEPERGIWSSILGIMGLIRRKK
ncbi:hypothetical protein HII31_12372 [Pseudocercospora fuligena]|uniref:Uncharacterized protein n=1 Tax=Pseudocercospora fuligena TaxID=685502 RepID=A0A8H6VD80_9PEZI|nr:hypothetical protein HII31_12372 [Pseudocercospora fuligena]